MSFSEILINIKDFAYDKGWRVLTFVVVLVLGVIAVRLFGKIIRKAFAKGHMGKSLGGFLSTVIKFFLYLVLVFVLAGIVGIDLSPFTTVLLSAGLAVSLALQDSLSNVANGMIIVTTKPFEEGDYIELSGVSGKVLRIGLISTQLVTPDNRKISIPNTKIMSDTVINITANPIRRVDLVFSVSRDADPDLVKKVLFDTLSAHKNALAEPPPMVKMSAITESSFDYIARAWVKTDDYWESYWMLTEQIAMELRRAGIKIPYRTLDLNMCNNPNMNNNPSTLDDDTRKQDKEN